MIDRGKKSVLGVLVDAVDYEGAAVRIMQAAFAGRSYAVSALAVHGVMTGFENEEHKYRLNSFDLIVPDGQPVRWALNLIHKCDLASRVYGPELTLKILERAAHERLPVYFYGTTPEILASLKRNLARRFPELIIAGAEPSKFRTLNNSERHALAQRIRDSGAAITMVGLGCPRQEIFVYEMRPLLSMPLLAVGAAFAFIAGTLRQAPAGMQKRGLEWLFRLKEEPNRLWRRYLILNPYYVLLLCGQWIGRNYPAIGMRPTNEIGYG
jgi:N-acetylglucosaminyldiphosphoundecaprenol N-acetyl-beta-D-mannosaminyltransferase